MSIHVHTYPCICICNCKVEKETLALKQKKKKKKEKCPKRGHMGQVVGTQKMWWSKPNLYLAAILDMGHGLDT